MEGLIPLVYRSLKKSHTRRKYECLSSGVTEAYNIADFYVKDEGRYNLGTSGPGDDAAGRRAARHWRSGSMAVDGRDFALEGGGGGGGAPTPSKKQLVRFRSHRMLACITGA